jgi:hypothetical protein
MLRISVVFIGVDRDGVKTWRAERFFRSHGLPAIARVVDFLEEDSVNLKGTLEIGDWILGFQSQ